MLGTPRWPTFRSSIALVAVAAFAIFAAGGCSKQPEIARYQVPKEAAPETKSPAAKPDAGESATKPDTDAQPGPAAAGGSDRMLAAIAPVGDVAWFFKLAGSKDAVGKHAKAFDELVESVTFTEDGEPKWKQPEGWERQDGNQFRYATLLIPGDDGAAPLELTVSRLPWNAEGAAEAVLANVNRWRVQQMTLPPLKADELEKETRKLKLADGEAIVADLEGTLQAGGMRPPFARPPAAGTEN